VITPGTSFLVGPAVALVALGLIVLLCRWVFSTDDRQRREARRLQAARARGDYGLLVPVATARTREDAQMLRTVLHGAGIRCTLAADASDTHEVLVFRDDAERAQQLVAS
jgi:hypothetical protein